MSWYRCREEYGVDPCLDRAPAAAEASPHSIERDVVFAELGGLAANAADGGRRPRLPGHRDRPRRTRPGVLGRPACPQLAEDSNLAPWYTWSEWAKRHQRHGNRPGKPRSRHSRGPEHWCRAFHAWICAGIAVRNVVTDEPLAVLGISCWRRAAARHRAVMAPQSGRSDRGHAARARRAVPAPPGGCLRRRPAGTLDAACRSGRGRECRTGQYRGCRPAGNSRGRPAYAPADRWAPQLPALPQLAAGPWSAPGKIPHWTGATQVFVPFLGASVPVAVRPVSTRVR